jgi:hypothetical protein
MGSYDGAETCEIVGLYLLSELRHIIPNINIGLYRDDGLAICRGRPRSIELIKKQICNIFQSHSLRITIEANKTSVNFLDLTLDVTNGVYTPYMKPNNAILYVNKNSNHPPAIIKNIPESINKRLSNISSNEAIFKEAIPPYQAALEMSGYQYRLSYKPQRDTNTTNRGRSGRKRNVSWFNPPFSQNVITNIGKQFFKLLTKCFPARSPLHTILNKNTIKLSYSCMPSIGQQISAHNKKLLSEDNSNTDADNIRTCNCRAGTTQCPLDGECMKEAMVYQATVTRPDTDQRETYIGLTANSFKKRFYGHKSSFRNVSDRNATTLSQHIWTLKESGLPYSIDWRIITHAQPYSPSTKHCNLCLTEKYFIICKNEMGTLNTRNELVNTCRHRKKQLLANAIT